MPVNPLTPGVYTEEIAVFPASIAGVDTAIPAFIGYVEKAEKNGVGIPLFTPVRITSLLEYESIFGGAKAQGFTVDINDNTLANPMQRTIAVTKQTESGYRMYYNMQLYFANGGGPCYIVPIGLYAFASISNSDMLDGLAAIAKVDEATLLVFPESTSLTLAQVKPVYDAALAQCLLLKDRFVIMDVLQTGGGAVSDSNNFRSTGVGADNLKYGAAYYPYLKSTLGFKIDNQLVHVGAYSVNGIPYGASPSDSVDAIAFMSLVDEAYAATRDALNYAIISAQTLTGDSATIAQGLVADAVTAITNADGAAADAVTAFAAYGAADTAIGAALTLTTATTAAATAYVTTPETAEATDLINALKTQLAAVASAQVQVNNALNTINASGVVFPAGNLAYLQTKIPTVYGSILSQINAERVTLNPSGAMAGIYARVDAERGVWKAPANVSVRNVVAPAINITNSQQDSMNVDATSGKSINALRAFTGKGTLVWGGRTLAGNDNEWRYINVRRLFNYVEESVAKAAAFYVFESNDANTWLRLKGMIDNFLTNLWRDGALAGATTKEAFYVNVGLGTTMTAEDILEGKLIIDIGLAAVRPAEFIVLRFMHKLQVS